MRTGEGNDALAYVDKDRQQHHRIAVGNPLRRGVPPGHTPAQPRHDSHHALVEKGIKHIVTKEKTIGGALGRPSGARFRTYTRLKEYADQQPRPAL